MIANVINKLVNNELDLMSLRICRRIVAVQRAYQLIQRESRVMGKDIEEVKYFNVNDLQNAILDVINSKFK